MKEKWKEYFKGRNASVRFSITLVLLVFCLYILSRFIIFAESRTGVVLDDSVFRWFKAEDLNIVIFTLIYGSLISGIVYLVRNNPKGLVVALQTYTVMVMARMAMM